MSTYGDANSYGFLKLKLYNSTSVTFDYNNNEYFPKIKFTWGI